MKLPELALLVCASVIAVSLPYFVYPVFLMQAMSLALFACGFNLLLGFTGILSFGHAALFGSAAYICGYTAKTWGLPTELAVASGTAASACLGLLYGIVAMRQRGIYLAMITFALSQMIFFFCLQAPFTGGEDGLQSVPRGTLLGLIDLTPSLNMYYVELGIFVLALLLIVRIVRSPFGQVLRAMKENEVRTVSLGYNVEAIKIISFVMSGALCGLAGSLKVLALGLASLADVQWHVNGEVILMTLLGGLGTFLGPVVGAFLVVGMQNYLAQLGGTVTIAEGVLFALIIMTFRRGIIGELQPIFKRLFSRPAALKSGSGGAAASNRASE